MAEQVQKVHLLEEGDEIMILVGGHPVPTYIDEHGTQRFMTSKVIDWLWRTGKIDLHQLTINFYRGDFDRDSFMDLHMSLGYSVGGFNELWGPSSSYFDNTGEYVEIINPVWIDEKEMLEMQET